MRVPANKGLLYTTLSALLIISVSYLAIQYAKGKYRFTETGFSGNSGLLAANSFPSGAEVYINDKLTTATDDTVYLDPGEYQVRISKDGFTTWEKTLQLESELVTQTNAQLFPSAPGLSPLTFTGIQNLSPSPDGLKILYYSKENSNPARNGLYLLDLSGSTLPLQRGPKQISDDSELFDLATAQFIWSPDSSQLLLVTKNKTMLLELNEKSDLDFLPDVSRTQSTTIDAWEEEMFLREKQFLAKFPKEIITIATESAENVYISPDKKRLLYTATENLTIPDGITPPIPAANTQPEERQLVVGGIYVYDREEDRNFRVGTQPDELKFPIKQLLSLDVGEPSLLPQLSATSSAYRTLQATESALTASNFKTYHSSLYADTLQWFPDSKHLLLTDGQSIKISEYDLTNITTLFSGTLAENFVYPSPDGSRLIIATSFSPDTPTNLYALELK